MIHFFVALPVMWAYCLVEYMSIAQLSVYGKAKCQHIPSKKDKLLGKATGDQSKVTELADITQHERLEVRLLVVGFPCLQATTPPLPCFALVQCPC